MSDLETRLAELGREEYPATPDFAPAIGARLRAPSEVPPRRRYGGRSLAVALALLALPAAGLAAVPDVRHNVLRWLGIDGVRVERVERLPEVSRFRGLHLGDRVATPQEAGRRAGFSVEIPSILGKPDDIFVNSAGAVSLTYAPRKQLPRERTTGLGLVVTEIKIGPTNSVMFLKQITHRTRVEEVRVRGARGFFVSGPLHAVQYVTPSERQAQTPARLAGNTLVFQRARVVFRLEARFSKRRALALANSM